MYHHDEKRGTIIYLRLCGHLSSNASSGCSQQNASASLCEVDDFQYGSSITLGTSEPANPPQWSFIDSNNKSAGVQYSLTPVSWSGDTLGASYDSPAQAAACSCSCLICRFVASFCSRVLFVRSFVFF